MSAAAGSVVEDTRRRLARFLGVSDSRRVIFTAGCTDSVNLALRGLLVPGDHAVASSLDHNSVSRPLEFLAHSRKVQITRVPFGPDHRLDPAALRRAIGNRTKVIVLTHGSNVLGSVQPLADAVEIARGAGVPLLLDAAQTAGRIPVSEGGERVLIACAAHKGLYGLPGLGILTVPADVELEKWRLGGTGTASESLEHPDEMPMRFEAGTLNAPAIAATGYGVEFIESEGMSRIHAHECSLALRLVEFLQRDARFQVYSGPGSGESLAVVSFNLRGVASQEVSAILDQTFGIAVRGGLHCAAVVHRQLGTVPDGTVRVSPGYFNTTDDIDALTAALAQIAAGY